MVFDVRVGVIFLKRVNAPVFAVDESYAGSARLRGVVHAARYRHALYHAVLELSVIRVVAAVAEHEFFKVGYLSALAVARGYAADNGVVELVRAVRVARVKTQALLIISARVAALYPHAAVLRKLRFAVLDEVDVHGALPVLALIVGVVFHIYARLLVEKIIAVGDYRDYRNTVVGVVADADEVGSRSHAARLTVFYRHRAYNSALVHLYLGLRWAAVPEIIVPVGKKLALHG